LKSVPPAWAAAGPTTNGVQNYLAAGPGLGSPNARGDREALLDKVPGVTPLRATGLKMLVGRQVCAVVADGDVGMNYAPLDGTLKGASLGLVAFRVVAVAPAGRSSSLPDVDVEILNTADVCRTPLRMLQAPEPRSSSEPADLVP
jgi:hypothetical protein